jgi:NAD(P)-dependent dehydrogenase (short-subunit alcohol dehydrogenase family)
MSPADLFDLRGKVACVTGASSGLGRSAASMLAAAGARVVGVARRTDGLAQWQSETRGDTHAVATDLSELADLPSVAQRICAAFGGPDILVNAAGINTRQQADDVTPEMWDLTQSVNVAAPFFLAQALVPRMRAKGWGRIVNFASLQSRRAFANGIAYGTSKGAVEQLTRAMAEAWSRDGVTANALAPGFFRTELTAPVFADPALTERNAAQTCVGRNGTVEDLHGPLLFLCSRASDYVTGQVLFVDGGFTAK